MSSLSLSLFSPLFTFLAYASIHLAITSDVRMAFRRSKNGMDSEAYRLVSSETHRSGNGYNIDFQFTRQLNPQNGSILGRRSLIEAVLNNPRYLIRRIM